MLAHSTGIYGGGTSSTPNQSNTGSSRASQDLDQGPAQRDLCISLIQEPHTFRGRASHIPKGIHVVMGGTQPRAMILASPEARIWPVPDLTARDTATALLHIESKGKSETIMIISSYLDITKTVDDMFPTELIAAVKRCIQLKIPVIIGSDTNAHSQLWSEDSNPRGLAMEEFILQFGLDVENVGLQPTFIARGSHTIIDVTLTLGAQVRDWRVEDSATLSDHRLIRFRLGAQHEEEVKMTYNFNKMNWEKFKQFLENSDIKYQPDVWNSHTIDEGALQLQTLIQKAIAESCPMSRPRKTTPLPFWSSELAEDQRTLRRAERKSQRSGSDVDLARYKELKREFKLSVRQAKKTSWRDFTSSTNDAKGIARLVKTIQGNSTKQLGLLNHNGSCTSTPEQTLHALCDVHFPGSLDSPPEANTNEVPSLTPEQVMEHEAGGFITDEKVKAAVSSFTPGKAAGPDQIRPEVLQNLPDGIIMLMTILFKAIIILGYNPKIWNFSSVVFLPKPGKSDYSNPKSFRPISLTSFCLKTLERLVLWHLEETALKSNPLNRNQHAFRRGYSTSSALSCAVDRIERAILRGRYALCVSLDIAGAFDNARIDKIAEGFRRKGTPDNIIKWYVNYLSSRTVDIDIKGARVRRWLVLGVAQGGVLSPLGWAVNFDSLLDLFSKGPVVCIGFADDGLLLVTGPDQYVLRSLMQGAINQVLAWGEENGLQFSAAKTKVVLFHRKKKVDYPEPLCMGDTVLPYDRQVRYLGIILDDKLSYTQHVNDKIGAAKRLLIKSNNALGREWGPKPFILRWAYTGIVRPAITYGSIVWAKEISKYQDQLTKLQRLANRSLCHFRRSTPSAGIEVVTGLIPLDLYIKGEAAMSQLRTMPRVPTLWDGRGNARKMGHRLWNQTFLEGVGHPTTALDELIWEWNWEKPYQLDRASFDDGKPLPNEDDYVTVYTDGSSRESFQGWGSAIKFPGVETPLSIFGSLGNTATVFQGEIHAIERACRELNSFPIVNQEIVLNVDSQAALLALDKHFYQSSTVGSCISALRILASSNTVTLRWVRAHVGHVLNEVADQLAKKGTEDNLDVTHLHVPKAVVKTGVNNHLIKLWDNRWKALETCRQTKLFFPIVNIPRSKKLLRLSRQDLGLLIQVATGHGYNNYHHGKINPGVDPTCRLCLEEDETVHHIVADCPALAAPRFELFGVPYSIQTNQVFPWCQVKLLIFLKRPEVRDLLVPRGDEV